MRKDNRPYWLKQISDGLNRLYVSHVIAPQFDQCGHGLCVFSPRHLHISGAAINVADHVHFMALADAPVRLAVYENLGSIEIGSNSIINPGVRITSASRITIGRNCMLAMNAYLSDADWHDLQHRIFAPGNSAPITLGDNVWIGEGALVCKGVEIGDNAVVGAYSVVTHNVEPNAVVAGNPARLVKTLDPDDLTTREALFTNTVFTRYESFADYEARFFSERMQGNTLLGWLRSRLLPGRTD